MTTLQSRDRLSGIVSLSPTLRTCIMLRLGCALLCLVSSAPVLAAEWKPVEGFFQWPAGLELGACTAVAQNSRGEIFVFHRGKRPLLVFSADGKFLRSWGDDL